MFRACLYVTVAGAAHSLHGTGVTQIIISPEENMQHAAEPSKTITN